MISSLKAEFRKLLSVRSTYFTVLAVLALIGLIATLNAYKNSPKFGPTDVRAAIFNGAGVAQIIGGIVSILLIAYEYRYNLIDYTLTITNRRSKIFVSKFVVTSVYAVVLALLAVAATWGFTMLGIHLKGAHIVAQELPLVSTLCKSLALVVGSIWAGLVFGFLFRSVVFAMVTYFLVPLMLEPLLHGLLKVSNNYLPFAALNQVTLPHMPHMFSPVASAGVFLAYLAAAGIAAIILFTRRDANS